MCCDTAMCCVYELLCESNYFIQLKIIPFYLRPFKYQANFIFNCFLVTEKSSLVDIDPKQFCGFNPCDISKCLLAPLGSCVSDYKCHPVFFDENNKRIEGCAGK